MYSFISFMARWQLNGTFIRSDFIAGLTVLNGNKSSTEQGNIPPFRLKVGNKTREPAYPISLLKVFGSDELKS